MFKSLEEALSSCSIKQEEVGNVVCVRTDLKTNCQFLITHLLCSHLSMGRNVLLISLHETFSHNAAIAMKLGVNIMKYKQQGTLRFVDAMEYLVEPNDGNLNNPFNFDTNKKFPASNLKDLFNENIKDWRESKTDSAMQYTIIIDRINVLYSLGMEPKEINTFVRLVKSCLYGGNKQNTKPLGSLYISTEVSSSPESKYIADSQSSMADQIIMIEKLKTGRCREVDGNLGIMYKKTNGLVDIKSFQYQVHEKSIDIFSHGMASSVI